MKKFKDRCWEYMRCNEEKSCAAFPDYCEECWAIAGTMRNTESDKTLSKMSQAAQDSGRDLSEPQFLQMNPGAKTSKLCKFIERFGTCRCCPYYKYVQEFERRHIDRK
ncbi:MAG: hypothetical protein KKB82_00145 [Candidatus Omnitrophica bacterium]|nr:hypothetical protein [Candidatus Omnitrophota bacterium]MBU1924312.1 hypothetical protein [Candidatus Omnitrophota bacterium]MBU2064064.1 hypothetical protein [Candidatus Omnitrophota bacterium]